MTAKVASVIVKYRISLSAMPPRFVCLFIRSTGV